MAYVNYLPKQQTSAIVQLSCKQGLNNRFYSCKLGISRKYNQKKSEYEKK